MMRRFTIPALLTLFSSTLTTAAQPTSLPSTATETEAAIVSVMQRTIDHAPAARHLRLSLSSATLASDAEIAPEGPTVTWQSEGFDASLDREVNAVDYLRIGKSFGYPWRRVLDRDLRHHQDTWAAVAERAGLLDLAMASGKRWLAWAAAEAELTLAEARVTRVERALTLQQKKLELGEVAGAEVEQLRLEHARDQGNVRRARAQVRTLAAALAAHVGAEVERPGDGALEALVEALGPLPEAAAADPASDDGLLAAARARAAAEAARSRFRRARAWGLPTAEIEWERVPTIEGIDGFDTFGFNVSVPLPVGKRGRVLRAQAVIDAEAAEADREGIERLVAQRRAAARAEAEAAAQNLAALDEILGRMPATESSLTERFRLGAISYLVLIDGLSRLDDVRREAIDARQRLLGARLELAVLEIDRSMFPLPALEVAP